MKNKKLEKIKAVGFDVDGTLYHAPMEMGIEVGKILVNKAAEALGREPDELVGEYLERREVYRSSTKTLNSFGLPGEEIFRAVWSQIPLEKYVKPDKKLARMMKELKRKYRLFIVSNNRKIEIERKLACLGVDQTLFDPIVSCYDQGWVKPEPAPFLASIESLNLKPEEIVYVGDRLDIDIEGARGVGMKTILVGSTSDLADACCETVYDVGLLL